MLFEPHRNNRNIEFHIDYVFFHCVYMSARVPTKEGWFNFQTKHYLLTDPVRLVIYL